MPTVAFYTLGCKVNQQETDAMRMLFEHAGYTAVPFEEVADVYVVNTCTVTQTSDKKSRQSIAKAHARNPQACIAVVGCYAQQAADIVKTLPGVRLVLGTQHRRSIVERVEALEGTKGPLNAVEDIQKARLFEALPVAAQGTRTRAQLKIQDGCDRYCSYCIIPYARGAVRSSKAEDIQQGLRSLGEKGVEEVVLTGIHLMSYGKDLPGEARLDDIVRMAASTPGIGRIRLGSLEPALIDEAFVRGLSAVEPHKLCRQFHLSLQSGSSTVLQRMNRRYTPTAYAQAVQRLRRAFPGCAITTDIIAGFPGETDKEHVQTLAFIKEVEFARIHVFPYSRRTGTKAASMAGQLTKTQKDERAKAIMTLGKQQEQAYLFGQLGQTLEVLFEEQADGYSEGYAGNYVRVRAHGALPNKILPVRALDIKYGVLVGEPIGEQGI